MERKQYKPYPDSGTIRASQTKKTPKSPDYWGSIAIDLKNQTNIHVEDGLTIIKLSGWKKVDASGKTYLSLSVNRSVPENAAPREIQREPVVDENDDIPF